MKETRRIIITATRRRTLRFHVTGLRALCPVCAREVETLGCAQAAEVLEVDGEILDGLIAAGRVHTLRMVSGNLRVCRDSLFD
ncbi:MAG: hypothetical protein AB7U82_06785 [Blastocatellales bacterium]